MYYVHPVIIAYLHDLITAAMSSSATCVHSLASRQEELDQRMLLSG